MIAVYNLQKGTIMGLFTSYFTKPGPGVDKNAPEKLRIWQFFEIFWGQLSKLCLMNMVYFIAMIPLVLGLFLCFDFNIDAPLFIALPTNADGIPTMDLAGLILIVVSVFVSFPATLGFTFVLRNIQRREHAWIWHDFLKHIKANYKKGVINGVVTLLVYYLLFNAHTLYYSQTVFSSGYANTFLAMLMVALMVLFTWAQFYVNTMIVTFDLKLKDIYRNAFLFAISKVPLNILISIICVLLGFGVFVLFYIIPVLAVLLAFLILYSLFGFITVFCVYPTIDKYMIEPVTEKSEEEETDI